MKKNPVRVFIFSAHAVLVLCFSCPWTRVGEMHACGIEGCPEVNFLGSRTFLSGGLKTVELKAALTYNSNNSRGRWERSKPNYAASCPTTFFFSFFSFGSQNLSATASRIRRSGAYETGALTARQMKGLLIEAVTCHVARPVWKDIISTAGRGEDRVGQKGRY